MAFMVQRRVVLAYSSKSFPKRFIHRWRLIFSILSAQQQSATLLISEPALVNHKYNALAQHCQWKMLWVVPSRKDLSKFTGQLREEIIRLAQIYYNTLHCTQPHLIIIILKTPLSSWSVFPYTLSGSTFSHAKFTAEYTSVVLFSTSV